MHAVHWKARNHRSLKRALAIQVLQVLVCITRMFAQTLTPNPCGNPRCGTMHHTSPKYLYPPLHPPNSGTDKFSPKRMNVKSRHIESKTPQQPETCTSHIIVSVYYMSMCSDTNTNPVVAATQNSDTDRFSPKRMYVKSRHTKAISHSLNRALAIQFQCASVYGMQVMACLTTPSSAIQQLPCCRLGTHLLHLYFLSTS